MRPDWNDYFMSISILISKRSTCIRRKVGAIIVKDKRILATGYNGVPTGITHCNEIGCLREKLNVPSGKMHELCRGLHAEQNAIIQAAYHGVAIKGADLYCTNQPCVICTKMIINAGIKNIYYKDPYHDELSIEMLKETDISLIHLPYNES
jgi:dCMP deaminase